MVQKASSIIRELLCEAEANPLSYEGEPRLDLDTEAAERVIAWLMMEPVYTIGQKLPSYMAVAPVGQVTCSA